MEFQNTFQVAAPIDTVWELLLDVERIAPCVPGAQVLEQTGDEAYKVAVKVRIGPMTMNYKGDIEITGKDEAAHEATMAAKAKEARGQGTAKADIRMALSEQGGLTTASIVTEMQMSGKAAAMGQGVIKDVAGAITDTFAENLAAMIGRGGAAASEPEPTPAASDLAPDAGGPPSPSTAVPPPPPTGAVPPRSAAPPPPPADAAEASLPVGKLVAAVVTGRLQDPRTAGVLVLLAFLVGLATGRRGR